MALPPPAGAVVVYWEDDAPAFAVVLGEEKQRVALATESGREERIAPGRIALEIRRLPAPKPTPEGRRGASADAAAARAEAAARALEVDVPTLWELVRDRPVPASDDLLAEIALGTKEGRDRAAVVLAMTEDGVRFVRRGGAWQTRDSGSLAAILAERASVSVRRQEREAAISSLGEAWRSGTWAPCGNETERRIVSALTTVALADADAPERERALALEALGEIGVRADRPHEGAFRLLRRLGRFGSDDENLAILRYGFRTAFPAEVASAAEEAAASGFTREGRADFTSRHAVTIDAPHTKEIDDALTIAPWGDGGFELGVHIADPCAFIAAGDPVDLEASARGTTYYFPDRKLLMIPPAISEVAASLIEGQDRPVLSFLLRVEASGRVAGHEIARGIVRVARRLDYDTADAMLATAEPSADPSLALLARCAEARETLRGRAGALLLKAEEVEAHVGPSGEMWLTRRDPHSPSQRIVAEAMVLAGEVAAAWLDARRVPAVYRRQAAPDGPLPSADPDLPEVVHARALRRMMRRGEAGTSPAPHFGLGLNAYAQVTSPLRRYQDMALHRQIVAVLASGSPAYGAAEMQAILASTERAEIDGRRAERAADRYWMLKWIERAAGGTVTGVVADTVPRPLVVLDETLLEEPVPSLTGAAVGDRVRLRVERVNPRADLLVLRPV